MKMSHMLGHRTKQDPSDAKLKSHKLLIRGGYIRPVSNGIYSILLPGQKVLKNIEHIIREEMNAIEGQEVEMPLVQPKELWEESGRYQSINSELIRFKDRNGHNMVLAMTHEEAAVALVRTEAVSYKNYPFMIYQFAKKFRDEARPRGGLIRVREFTMKDAYSFHTSQKDLEAYYTKCAKAYSRIFAKAGIPEVVAIKSDSGMMGGNVSHEYMLLTESGEDTIVTCPNCNYKANKEIAVSKIPVENGQHIDKPLQKIHTPNAKSIEELSEMLNLPKSRFLKTIFYKPIGKDNKPIAVMIRGDIEVNENKLAKILGGYPEFANDKIIENTGAVVGFASGFGIEERCHILVDKSIQDEKNLITGANEKDYHIANFNLNRDMPNARIFDIASVKEGNRCVNCGNELKINRGIEVGNIFQLGEKYTSKMNMRYIDENGKQQTPVMGCYGIGIGRLMASVAEVRNDERGIIWPVSIAPWKMSIISLSPKNENDTSIDDNAKKLYTSLRANGLDVIWDDRKTSAGEKFADTDLLGIPMQFIVSPKNLEKGLIEWKERATGNKGFISIDEITQFATQWFSAAMDKLNTTADNVKPLPKIEISNTPKTDNKINIFRQILKDKILSK